MTTQEEEDFFWKIIQQSNKKIKGNWDEYDIDEHIDDLTELLTKKSKQKLIVFEKVFQKSMNKLDTAEIAELSIILENSYTNHNGKIVFEDYISTDGFIYFRCWLILKGKAFFDEILADINAFVNGKYSFNIGDTSAEGLLYLSDQANLMRNSDAEEFEISDFIRENFPEIIHYDSLQNEFNRAVASGDALASMYPKLVGEIIKIK
jgi:Protein of unknown function (DUF4240)